MEVKNELIEKLQKALKYYSDLLEKNPNDYYCQEMITKCVLALKVVENEKVKIVKDRSLLTAGINAKNGIVVIYLGKIYDSILNNDDLVNLIVHEVKHLIDGDITNETKRSLENIVEHVANIKANELISLGFQVDIEKLKNALLIKAHEFYNVVSDIVINSEQNISSIAGFEVYNYNNASDLVLEEGEIVIHYKLMKVRDLLLKTKFTIILDNWEMGGTTFNLFDNVSPGGIDYEGLNDIIFKTRIGFINEITQNSKFSTENKSKILNYLDKVTHVKRVFFPARREEKGKLYKVKLEYVDFNYNKIKRFIESAEETYSYERTYRRERYGIPLRIPIPYYSVGILVDTSGSVADIVGEFAGVLRKLAKDHKLIVGVFSSYNDYYIFELEPSATVSKIEDKLKAFLGGTEILGVWREMYRRYRLKHYIILSDFMLYDEKDAIKFVKENNFKILAIVNKDIYEKSIGYLCRITNRNNIVTYKRKVIEL